MPNIGAPELIIILVIALLILGPGKLPEVGASIGKSLREFRKASSDVQEATKLDISPTDAATPAAARAGRPGRGRGRRGRSARARMPMRSPPRRPPSPPPKRPVSPPPMPRP